MVANNVKKKEMEQIKKELHELLYHTVTLAENLLNIKFWIPMNDTDNRSDKSKPISQSHLHN